MIEISPRTDGMIDASANYYQDAEVFKYIQNAQALEYDRIEVNNADLALQLSPLTATWGLVYWEESVGLSTHISGDLETRRATVLTRLYGDENFSAPLLKKLVNAYGIDCEIAINGRDSMVYVYFPDGLPSCFAEIADTLQNYIHAHLDIEYAPKITEIPYDITAAIMCAKEVSWETILSDEVETYKEFEITTDLRAVTAVVLDVSNETIIYNKTKAICGVALCGQAVAGKEI